MGKKQCGTINFLVVGGCFCLIIKVRDRIPAFRKETQQTRGDYNIIGNMFCLSMRENRRLLLYGSLQKDQRDRVRNRFPQKLRWVQIRNPPYKFIRKRILSKSE